eukprot:Blabericola_migrator_1__4388@NODE_2357_length_2887_cov_12_658865_g1475_i0_p1_GENE_NODE_2357_length_2887_cov_12_658865_g1475_i0NODE_2357_length_2887_cov_12_658865_g1475_i0_p1_ORF_typecomplete_len654_score124_38HC2/PF07382_11/1_NODE_2357_length_2887_cov_12_658865_g1475_i03732334
MSRRGSRVDLGRSDTFHDKINREIARQQERKRQRLTRPSVGRQRPSITVRGEVPLHYKLSESIKSLPSYDSSDDVSLNSRSPGREDFDRRRNADRTRDDLSADRRRSREDLSADRRRGSQSPDRGRSGWSPKRAPDLVKEIKKGLSDKAPVKEKSSLKTVSKVEKKAETGLKKVDTKKADVKKLDAKKSDVKKADMTKLNLTKDDAKKTTDVKKGDAKKVDVKKSAGLTNPAGSNVKQADLKKTAVKRTDVKKAADPKKMDSKKGITGVKDAGKVPTSKSVESGVSPRSSVGDESIGTSTEEEILKIWAPQALFGKGVPMSQAQRRASQMSDAERHHALVKRRESLLKRRSVANSIVASTLQYGPPPDPSIMKKDVLDQAKAGIDYLSAWPGVGIVSLPNREKMIPPGVYFDENLTRTQPAYPMEIDKALAMAGPFGVGEAKACLDDLQATVLHMYSKLYKVEPDLPLDWQIEQLQRSYYPSPYPISGNPQGLNPHGEDLGVLGGALPPPFPNGVPQTKAAGDTKYKWQGDIEVKGDLKDLVRDGGIKGGGDPKSKGPVKEDPAVVSRGNDPAGVAVKGGSLSSDPALMSKGNGPAASAKGDTKGDKSTLDAKPISGIEQVIHELQELAEANAKQIEGLNKDLMQTVADPTST